MIMTQQNYLSKVVQSNKFLSTIHLLTIQTKKFRYNKLNNLTMLNYYRFKVKKTKIKCLYRL